MCKPVPAAILAAFACQAVPVFAADVDSPPAAAPAVSPSVATPAPVQAAAVPAQAGTKLTANLGFVSDYLFRGITQTAHAPAIQGGVDYAPDTGFYAGTWASNVSGNFFPGGSLEWDVYGGYNHKVSEDLAWSAGLYTYNYPGAHTVPGHQSFNTVEANAQVTWKGLQLKDSYALTDLLGMNSASMPGGVANGHSRGSDYVEVNYTHDLPGKIATVGLHAGHQAIRNYPFASYADYRIGLSRAMAGWTWGLAATASNAKKGLFVGTDGKEYADSAVFLSVLKAF